MLMYLWYRRDPKCLLCSSIITNFYSKSKISIPGVSWTFQSSKQILWQSQNSSLSQTHGKGTSDMPADRTQLLWDDRENRYFTAAAHAITHSAKCILWNWDVLIKILFANYSNSWGPQEHAVKTACIKKYGHDNQRSKAENYFLSATGNCFLL